MARTKSNQPAVDVAAMAAEIRVRLEGLKTPTAPSVRAVRREFSKRVTRWPARAVVALGLRLLDEPGFFGRFVAYELIARHREALHSLRASDMPRLGRGLDSWAAVDTFSCYLAGPAWRERQVPDALIHRWARSPDRWWRRAAVVSTVPLNTKAAGRSGRCRTNDCCLQTADLRSRRYGCESPLVGTSRAGAARPRGRADVYRRV